MGKGSKIDALPDHVRDELAQRLTDQRFGGIVDAAAWLTQKGFPIGHSAVGVFSLQLKRHCQIVRTYGSLLAYADLRLRCATIAATEGMRGPDLFERAEQLLAWASEHQ